jgi:PAB-dependent poly(A)-specific ribonuclease subunit 3
LWSYVVQLASALKCVHNSGLAMRTVDVNRVLVTGKNRVRLGGGGVLDCLGWDGGQNIPAHQVRPEFGLFVGENVTLALS